MKDPVSVQSLDVQSYKMVYMFNEERTTIFLNMHSEIYFTFTYKSDSHTLKCTEKEEDGELSKCVCSILSRDMI